MTIRQKDLAINFSEARVDEGFNLGGRIVGGLVTSIANYPYQVSLQYLNVHICGGSIVAQNIVLTAAHCIMQPLGAAAFRVRAGSSTHLYGGQLVGVRHIFKHEAYSTLTLDSDVALVVLNKNLSYTRTVQPVELAAWGEHLPNNESELIVSGWGLTSETGGSYQYIAAISATMFCAGDPQDGRDSCQGDSGGPLVSFAQSPASSLLTTTIRHPTMPFKLQPKAMRPKQYGIVSWGVGCAQKSYPAIYTNVATLRPWIDENINKAYFL